MNVLKTNTPLPNLRKRKAEHGQNNERLTKRLSLLNLERDGEKPYILVEQPISQLPMPLIPSSSERPTGSNHDLMQIDDSKHKVYIHDLDAEILDTEPLGENLIILPDIEKHLLEYRLPPPVIPTADSPKDKQLILYNVPGSLTVSDEQDSVRRIIIETRARARAKQEALQNKMPDNQPRVPFRGNIIENRHVVCGSSVDLQSTSSFDQHNTEADVMELDVE